MLLEQAPQFNRIERHQLTAGEQLAAVGLQYLGAPSTAPQGPEHGMSPTDGFSCSGFVTYLLPRAGIRPPLTFDPKTSTVKQIRTVAHYDQFCEPIHWKDSKRGDLLIFFTVNHRTHRVGPGHIGILLERHPGGGGKQLHAPGLRESKVEIDDRWDLVPGRAWEQPELLPDYLQIRRIPETWKAV